MSDALAALLAVAWGINKLYSRTKNRIKNRIKKAAAALGSYRHPHQEAYRGCIIGSVLQFGYDQIQRISSLASAKHTFHLITFALISKQLLPVLSIYHFWPLDDLPICLPDSQIPALALKHFS